MRVVLAISAALAGCSGDPAPAPSQEPPTGWSWEDEAGAVEPDLAAMSAAAQDFIDSTRHVSAAPAVQAYQAAMAHSEPTCPDISTTTSETDGTVLHWQNTCHTSDYVEFKGPMTMYLWDNIDQQRANVPGLHGRLPDDGQLYTGVGLMGQTDIFTADGRIDYNCSCYAMQGASRSEATDSWFSLAEGPTHWTGPEIEGTWLDDPQLRAGLWQYYRHDKGDGAVQVQLRGSLSGFHERYDTILVDLAAGRRTDGSERCAASSSGRMSIRDAWSARWTSGDLVVTDTGSSCEACLDVGGEDMCFDLDSLWDWEEEPWF